MVGYRPWMAIRARLEERHPNVEEELMQLRGEITSLRQELASRAWDPVTSMTGRPGLRRTAVYRGGAVPLRCEMADSTKF